MENKRKIQFGASVVILSGLASFGALSPDPAHAAACADVTYCMGGYGVCNGDVLSVCQSGTPPGCTYVGATCTTTLCYESWMPQLFLYDVICHYQ